MRKLETTSDLLEFESHIEIESLSYYLDKLYVQLEDMTEDFMQWTRAEVQKIENEDKRSEFLGVNLVEYWQLTKVFPRLFLNSLHVAAYSLLETEVYSIASEVGRKHNQRFDPSDIRHGNYLESAIYYIRKLTGINAKTFSCWGGLTDGQKLRNIIVHSNSKVTKESDISLARKCGVYDTSSKEIAITHAYCESFIGSLREFFSDMYAQTKAGSFL